MWEEMDAAVLRLPDDLPAESPGLETSHRLCAHSGISRTTPAPRDRLPDDALSRLLADYANLVAYAQLLFHQIWRDVAGSWPRLLLLTEAHGWILSTASDPAILEYVAAQHRFHVGASLSETSCGTNALALALRHGRSTALQGTQHYCTWFHDCATAATPMVSNKGKVTGCVGIVAPLDGHSGDHVALARCLARELQPLAEPAARGLKGRALPPAGERATMLTARQTQALRLFAQGLSYKVIARQMGITSTKTVEEHIDAARAKLRTVSRRECIQKATELGLLRD